MTTRSPDTGSIVGPTFDGTGRYWRFALLSFIGWSLLAAIPTTSAYLGTGAEGLPIWWAMFKRIGIYYYLWGLLTPFIYKLTDALPYRGRGLLLTIPVHLLVLIVLSFALGLVSHQQAWQEWLIGARAAGYHSMSAFTYALIVLCCLSIKFYRLALLRQREASDARIHAAQLDSKLNLARVDSLRMQMNPHFLFNALNSIAALVDADRRDRAYEALEQLGDLLRRALRLSQASEVTLEDELQFSQAYLALEQVRFGERLHVEWQIDTGANGYLVPAFLLQPLIENAIKHAVSTSTGNVTVTIRTRLSADNLELCIQDSGRVGNSDTATRGEGLGIGNLQERLRLRYGDAALVRPDPGAAGYAVTVLLPRPLLAAIPPE